ncbi:MAG TPA: AbrB/MazE/SpoVT family DNA-binding domain-containing protein, partial [Chloroflexota bacterium]|nr:AbrB/MazE/SpoVT family DNA-binding domain-containing protein [Chloroflexota bacterium]
FAAGSIVLGETHDEFVVLDGAGRLQIPREYLDKLSIKKKVRLELDDDQIIIRAIPGEEEDGKRETTSRRWGLR